MADATDLVLDGEVHGALNGATETDRRPHSNIGASGAHRWIVCPGSVALSDGLPKLSTEEADEGTAAHQIASDCLTSGADGWEHIGRTLTVTDDEAGTSRTFIATDEMTGAVQVYLDAVRQDIAEYERRRAGDDWGAPRIFVEQGFHLVSIDEGAYGTADCIVWFPGWGLLRVYDYKHGKGIAVHVEENPQLQYYGVGAVDEILNTWGEDGAGGAEPKSFDIRDIELVVVQPRCTSGDTLVHRWRTTIDALGEWVDAVLKPAIARTRQPNAALVAGEHCRFCPAKQAGVCPIINAALAAHAADSVSVPEAQLEARARGMETWELAEKLAQRDLLRFALKTLEQEAERRLLAGEVVPGFKLVGKKADRVWQDGAFEEAVKYFGEEHCYVKKGKSPAQIEALDGGKAFVKGRAYKPDTGLTLAAADDRRTAVSVRPVADRFIGIKTQ